MPAQITSPISTKVENFEINSASTGITEADGSGTLWKDNWDYQIQINQFIEITPESIFSAYLVGDDAAEMPATTRMKVVRRDVTGEGERTILPELPYQQAKEFQDRPKLMRFKNLISTIRFVEGEHIVIRCAGADALTTGDLDASASRFSLKCQRRKKALG